MWYPLLAAGCNRGTSTAHLEVVAEVISPGPAQQGGGPPEQLAVAIGEPIEQAPDVLLRANTSLILPETPRIRSRRH